MAIKTFHELVQTVANHLAGRAVIIRWQKPAEKHLLAAAFKANGRAVIEITPCLDNRTFVTALAHEAAHIRYQFSGMVDLAQAQPPAQPTAAHLVGMKKQAYQTNEEQADFATRLWMAKAAPVAKYLEGSEAEVLLRALLTIKP